MFSRPTSQLSIITCGKQQSNWELLARLKLIRLSHTWCLGMLGQINRAGPRGRTSSWSIRGGSRLPTFCGESSLRKTSLLSRNDRWASSYLAYALFSNLLVYTVCQNRPTQCSKSNSLKWLTQFDLHQQRFGDDFVMSIEIKSQHSTQDSVLSIWMVKLQVGLIFLDHTKVCKYIYFNTNCNTTIVDIMKTLNHANSLWRSSYISE